MFVNVGGGRDELITCCGVGAHCALSVVVMTCSHWQPR